MYETKSIVEKRAIATFFFLYLSNGMNAKDMAWLRYSQLKAESFSFIREKTKNTSNEAQEIVVHLHDILKKIIADYGNKNKDGVVFPILKGKTIVKMEAARFRHKRVCNKALAKIGRELGFEVHLCLNLARHSFGTAHKILGTNLVYVSELMGHANTAMTAHYMKSYLMKIERNCPKNS